LLGAATGVALLYDLRDEASEREADEVNLIELQRLHERDGVAGHPCDRVRRRAFGRTDTAVVERDDVALGRDAVDDPRVPVVHHGGPVVQGRPRVRRRVLQRGARQPPTSTIWVSAPL
jgi:hypothetical protein